MRDGNEITPNRYKTAKGIEGEFEPGSQRRVLANKLRVRRKRIMDQLEIDALVEAQEIYLRTITSETKITVRHICMMHHQWLGEIYEWAGKYRSVELSKGGFTWPPARLVAQNMSTIVDKTLRKWTPCRPGPKESIAKAMAYVHRAICCSCTRFERVTVEFQDG
jgi:cell filamentation protein